MRLRRTLMTALVAFEDQCVLAKLVAQFVDVKSAAHAADCCHTAPPRPPADLNDPVCLRAAALASAIGGCPSSGPSRPPAPRPASRSTPAKELRRWRSRRT